MQLKKLRNRKIVSGILGIIAIGVFFVGATLVADTYHEELQRMVRVSGPLGMISYVFITALAIVVAPLSTLPLIAIAVSAWGLIIAGFLSVVGWVVGSQIAFVFAYVGSLPPGLQVISLIGIFLFVGSVYLVRKRF